MQLAISTNWNSTRHNTADGMLNEILSLGINSVEVGYSITQTQADGLEKWASVGKICITGVHSFCPPSNSGYSAGAGPECFSLCDPDDFKKNQFAIKSLKGTADFAKSVGGKYVVVHAGRVPINQHIVKLEQMAEENLIGTPSYQKQLMTVMDKRDKHISAYFNTLKESLRILLPYFEDIGIKLVLENLPSYDGIPNEPEMIELMGRFDSPSLGYWHDIGHAQIRHNLGYIHHGGILSRLKNFISGFHVHDVIAPTLDHCMPPKGMVKFNMFEQFAKTSLPFVLEPSRSVDSSEISKAIDYIKQLGLVD